MDPFLLLNFYFENTLPSNLNFTDIYDLFDLSPCLNLLIFAP